MQLGEGVSADDEDEIGLGMEGAELTDGVHGVGQARTVKLYVEGLEAGFVLDGQLQHGEAVGVAGQIGGGLVGRDGAGDEPDRAEIEKPQSFTGDGEVAFMHGVEGAPEQSDGAGGGGRGERRLH